LWFEKKKYKIINLNSIFEQKKNKIYSRIKKIEYEILAIRGTLIRKPLNTNSIGNNRLINYKNKLKYIKLISKYSTIKINNIFKNLNNHSIDKNFFLIELRKINKFLYFKLYSKKSLKQEYNKIFYNFLNKDNINKIIFYEILKYKNLKYELDKIIYKLFYIYIYSIKQKILFYGNFLKFKNNIKIVSNSIFKEKIKILKFNINTDISYILRYLKFLEFFGIFIDIKIINNILFKNYNNNVLSSYFLKKKEFLELIYKLSKINKNKNTYSSNLIDSTY
jgi:hypothetical protein